MQSVPSEKENWIIGIPDETKTWAIFEWCSGILKESAASQRVQFPESVVEMCWCKAEGTQVFRPGPNLTSGVNRFIGSIAPQSHHLVTIWPPLDSHGRELSNGGHGGQIVSVGGVMRSNGADKSIHAVGKIGPRWCWLWPCITRVLELTATCGPSFVCLTLASSGRELNISRCSLDFRRW